MILINFRRLRQDFPSSIIKEGQSCYHNRFVETVKIVGLNGQNIKLAARVQGAFENSYECELEIDRHQSNIVDSNCDCPYNYDCQHLAAVLFHLEENIDAILVDFDKNNDLSKKQDVNEEDRKSIAERIQKAKKKEIKRLDIEQQKELLDEYIGAAETLGQSPFFLPDEKLAADKAEMAVILIPESLNDNVRPKKVEVQIALRLPYRSKPLNIPCVKDFFNSYEYREPFYISSKRYFFSKESFPESDSALFTLLTNLVSFVEKNNADKSVKVAELTLEDLGTFLYEVQSRVSKKVNAKNSLKQALDPGAIYYKSMEDSLEFAPMPAEIILELEYLESPQPKLLLNPFLELNGHKVTLEQVMLLECASPGLLYEKTYFRFGDGIKRRHLKDLEAIRSVTIPEPLFGSFVENSLPELMRFAEVRGKERIEHLVTLPFVEELMAECDISYLNGELEAFLHFIYGKHKIPAAVSKLEVEHLRNFITAEGVLARNLTDEQKIVEDLFQDFVYDASEGSYSAKSEKKIVEFMTEVIPRNQHRVHFLCPENLLNQFIYDETSFELTLQESSRIDQYEVILKVNGDLEGVGLNTLWECIASKKAYLELSKKRPGKKKRGKGAALDNKGPHKILVLDLERITPIVQLFDEIGIEELANSSQLRPLWSLASLNEDQFKMLPIKFHMSERLKEIQEQMLGVKEVKVRGVPKEIKADLKGYQIEGASWLERLRLMHLNGILADDMGLGKTVQAISALTQHKKDNPNSVSLVVCPTSLVYNWKEELSKFNPELKVLVVDGIPNHRKKLIDSLEDYDIIVTSYSLLQKDIESYSKFNFGYAILDEAQHIKNRGTRNARSVKTIQSSHKLILTGTPIENSLEELWSLFDFLMPGLLSTYDRFVEKYIRSPSQEKGNNIEKLRQKVSPFILRRMKKDVLSELPEVSEIIYYCSLSDVQKELYKSYAESARRELSQLVQKEGFDKVQIHVLATLTRLKQICCHPAIFAKETPEENDSAKYEMLIDLLHNLTEGRHKTVVFSQYTRMLNIISRDLKKKGIPFEYLDGSSKNRLDIVNRFNNDENIPIFLVSLKAGGVGLNLVGADTVIHYDMWWNPAVENQATDRVHRIGQKNSVSAYKLITLNTIEEKILEMQNRKRGLVKKVVSTDEEAISKLTWEEVLELLQT